MTTSGLKRKITRVTELLEEHQGPIAWKGPKRNPLPGLIRTILSQATNDLNRDRAYMSLMDRFGGDWDKIRRGPTRAVRDAIRGAGLANQKAPRIQAVLKWARANYGGYDLKALCSMPEEEVFETLGSLKGVGVKTVAVVLMFACGADLSAVDTHVHRIMRRLGVVGQKATAERTFEILRPLVPEGKGHSLHLNLIAFGRSTCKARRPLCGTCFLRRLCLYYRTVFLRDEARAG